MNLEKSSPRSSLRRIIPILFAFALFFSAAPKAFAQQQLSLADLLIGLRSKKVSIVERNEILTEAIKQRGVTFTLSADIEKELTATGATTMLLDAIRAVAPKPAEPPAPIPTPDPTPEPTPTPIPTPTPPDFKFYRDRADLNYGKGEFALAVPDYDKAVELKPDSVVAFINRGRAHYNLKSFERSVSDFQKAIDLDPKDPTVYIDRGAAYEKLGNNEKAALDYQTAVDLDPANEPAKSALKRLKDEAERLAKESATPPTPEPIKPPEFLNLGALSAANATNMVMPVYSLAARRANVEGRVTVDVELDVKGNVVSANATGGPAMLRGQAEDAARRSKFRPAMFNGQPIKATGVITYNFSLKPGE